MTKLHKFLIAGYLIINVMCIILQCNCGIDYDYYYQYNIYYIDFHFIRLYSMIMFISTALFLFHWALLLASKTLKKQSEFEHHILKH